MKIGTALILLTFFTVHWSISAYAAGSCQEHIVKIIDSLDEVKTTVSLVPPEEDEYLTKVKNAWQADLENKVHFNSLNQRPLYRAWELHKNFGEALTDLKLNEQLPDDAPLKTRISMLASLPKSLSNAREAWSEYVYHEFRDKDALTMEQIRTGSYYMTSVNYILSQYINCIADNFTEANE